jgi:hypothetical protein
MSIKRQAQVFSAEAFYSIPELKGENPDNPLEVPRYSRCRLTIIDKTKKPNATPFANIPENDITYIKAATDIALSHRLSPVIPTTAHESGFSNEIIASNNEAFTMRFFSGDFKTKTPIEVLTENAKNKDKMLANISWLNENADNYPKNNDLIKGIKQAVALLDSGALDGVESESGPSQKGTITIYDQKMKFLSSTKDSEGRCLTYNISLICDLDRKYPFVITIENYYAFVKTTATGGANVELSGAVGHTKSTMYVTEIEFVTLVNKMYQTMRDYQGMHFAERYELKEKIDSDNRKKARESHTSV